VTGGAARDATRRALIAGSLSAALTVPAQAASLPFADLEGLVAGRLGVSALDTGTGRRISHRANERFALCSTFKLLLAIQIQSRIEAGLEQADRPVTFGKNDLVAYSPALEQGLAQGQVTVAELIRAVLELSDNGAANLLLRTQGGPEGLTRYLRGTVGRVTRLDRIEPGLNSVLPGALSRPAGVRSLPVARAFTVPTMAAGVLVSRRSPGRAELRSGSIRSSRVTRSPVPRR